jgi:RimJ/RimL family protein N-acetyltransferase
MSIHIPNTPEQKAALMEWARRLPVAIRAETALPVAVVRSGRIAAVILYHEWRGQNIEMSIVAETPRWATKQTVAFLLGYPFISYGVRRITALVERGNLRSRKLVEGLGFEPEGVMRHGSVNDDLCIYGMTRRWWEQSRWYREPPAEQKAA